MTVHKSFLRAPLLLGASLLALGLATASPALANDDEKKVTLKDQTAIAVTIYNANLAMVRDHRKIDLQAGINKLAFIDVSGRLRPETALLSSSDGTAFSLLEQNFDFDLLTPRKLLEKSVGGEVTVLRYNQKTKQYDPVRARVLSTVRGTVMEIEGKIYTSPPGRIVFDSVPKNLRARPTLVVTLNAPEAKKGDFELTYLTRGLSWRADYVALLSDKEDRLDLNGWVTLNNKSGTTFKNAKLQLVAGDVNVVRNRISRVMAMARKSRAAEDRAMRREALSDFHLYTLQRPTTLKNNQQKQVALMRANGVMVAKSYRLDGASYYFRRQWSGPLSTKAAVWFTFENSKKANLGLPLPRGVIRVYKKDSSGKAMFIGEARIDHTAENETVRLRTGKAFDVSGTRVQTDFKRDSFDRRIYETAWRHTLRNARSEAVWVTVTEPIGGQWQIISQSHPHKKVNAFRASWRIKVPAKGKTVLTWRVRVRY